MPEEYLHSGQLPSAPTLTLTLTITPTPTLTLTRWVQLNDERTEVMWGDLKVGGLLQP